VANTDIDRLDSAPLAERARTAILDAITSKQFVDRLPPEDEIADMLGVSRTTVRAALQSLEQSGIVTRRRAVGTTINTHIVPSRLALQRLVGYDELVREAGGEVRVEVGWERGPAPDDFDELFDLKGEEDFLITDKGYWSDGTQAIHIRDLVSWEELKSEPDGELPASLYTFSRRFMRRAIDHAIAEIVPMVSREPSTTALAVPEGEPFIRLQQRSYSQGGELLAVTITDVDDRGARFSVFRR
jgi:GntR family transcriptional regulator